MFQIVSWIQLRFLMVSKRVALAYSHVKRRFEVSLASSQGARVTDSMELAYRHHF